MPIGRRQPPGSANPSGKYPGRNNATLDMHPQPAVRMTSGSPGSKVGSRSVFPVDYVRGKTHYYYIQTTTVFTLLLYQAHSHYHNINAIEGTLNEHEAF